MNETPVSVWQPTKRLDRGNAADQILEDLRESILSGHFPRGAKLPTEKQLAAGYGVSGATIREAVRGLTTARLIEVRHGSGAYVTAETDQMIAFSLRSMIQLERIGLSQVLGVLGALIGFAAELAATHATADEIYGMQQALDKVERGDDADLITAGLTQFFDALALASGNALLAALCRFLTEIQVGLARELSGGSLDSLRKTTGRLAKERRRLVNAIKEKDPGEAVTAARAYHERALKVIAAQHSSSTTLADTVTSTFLTSLLKGKSV